MITSQKGINLIKKFESLHDGDLKKIGLQPKMCPAGIWTEGYGRAMRDIKGNFIRGAKNKELAYSRQSITTESQAERALIEDLKVYENIVMRKTDAILTQNKFDALVSHTYNTGGSATLFDYVDSDQPNSDSLIRYWFENRYIKADGKIMNGLINRRKAEANLFFTK